MEVSCPRSLLQNGGEILASDAIAIFEKKKHFVFPLYEARLQLCSVVSIVDYKQLPNLE